MRIACGFFRLVDCWSVCVYRVEWLIGRVDYGWCYSNDGGHDRCLDGRAVNFYATQVSQSFNSDNAHIISGIGAVTESLCSTVTYGADCWPGRCPMVFTDSFPNNPYGVAGVANYCHREASQILPKTVEYLKPDTMKGVKGLGDCGKADWGVNAIAV